MIISPIILTAIIHGLGFGAGGIAAKSFASWFMSLYGGMITRGSLVSVLQSIGAVGLGTLGTSISSGFGAAIGVFVGAIGGSELVTYLNKMELSEVEKQSLENLVQIEEKKFQNNNMVIFTLMPELLCNDTMLKCFVETFISCSPFANSKLFQINFKENDLKSEERVNTNIVHDLLISNYDESKMKIILNRNNIIGYNLDLNDYKLSNKMISLLVEIWKFINGVVVIDIDLNQIRDQIRDQLYDHIKNLSNQFYKFRSKL